MSRPRERSDSSSVGSDDVGSTDSGRRSGPADASGSLSPSASGSTTSREHALGSHSIGRDGGSLRSRKAWVALLIAMLIGLGADLWTKYWAFRTVAGDPVVVNREEAARTPRPSLLIPYHEPIVVIPNILEFSLVLNPGAVFGMGAGKRWFFVTLTGVAILMGLWLFAIWTRPRQWWAHVAIGLVLAGGLGNLYDRVVYACVRDFIHPLPGVTYPFGWTSPWSGREIWPWVSNVADKLLIIGISVLIWHILIGWKKRA